MSDSHEGLEDILKRTHDLTDLERTELICALLKQQRADRPIQIRQTNCEPDGDGHYRHTFCLTNTTNVQILITRVRYETGAAAGQRDHPVFLCQPFAETSLELRFDSTELRIKLSGYRLSPDASEETIGYWSERDQR